MMKIIKINDPNSKLKSLLDKRYAENKSNINIIVKNIIEDVKINGDNAIIKYSKKFDKILIDKNKIRLNTFKNKNDYIFL